MTRNSLCATLLQDQMASQNGLPCAEHVPLAAANLDTFLHIWMMQHQQGRLLCQGMRSTRSVPAKMQLAHCVNKWPCAAAREDLRS